MKPGIYFVMLISPTTDHLIPMTDSTHIRMRTFTSRAEAQSAAEGTLLGKSGWYAIYEAQSDV